MVPQHTLCTAAVGLSALVALALAGGCATAPNTKMQNDTQPDAEQANTYDRGPAQVQAGGDQPVRLTLVD